MRIQVRDSHLRAAIGRTRSIEYPAIVSSVTEKIADRASRELVSMRELLGDQADDFALNVLDNWLHATMGRIGYLVSRGIVCPFDPARRNAVSAHTPAARPLRLGVFPISGNPIHWLHIAAGLAAIECLALDRVFYVVAGSDDRKPDLAPEDFRHKAARDVLSLFDPLLVYSPIALGSRTDGEENFFRIIAEQGKGMIHAFYIAGSDHYRRFAALHEVPDTLQKIEAGVMGRAQGFDPGRHSVSIVFIARGGAARSVPSSLDVHWIDALPFQTSSTQIRFALAGEAPLSELSFLPIRVFRRICSDGLYSRGRTEYPGSPRGISSLSLESCLPMKA